MGCKNLRRTEAIGRENMFKNLTNAGRSGPRTSCPMDFDPRIGSTEFLKMIRLPKFSHFLPDQQLFSQNLNVSLRWPLIQR